MGDDLVSRDYYDPVPVRRDTRKRLARIDQEAMVRHAAIDAAARDALREQNAREQLAEGRALLRIKGTYDLSDYATHRSTQLNTSIGLQSKDNPRLEQIHRGFEDTAAITAQQIIYRYGNDQ